MSKGAVAVFRTELIEGYVTVDNYKKGVIIKAFFSNTVH